MHKVYSKFREWHDLAESDFERLKNANLILQKSIFVIYRK